LSFTADLFLIQTKSGLNPRPVIALLDVALPVYNLFAKLSAKVGAVEASAAKAM